VVDPHLATGAFLRLARDAGARALFRHPVSAIAARPPDGGWAVTAGGADCSQRRFLDAHGEGVFHLGFESDLDAAAGAASALGLRVLMRGQRDNGTGFIYFDTYDQAATVLLARQSTAARA
jgi:hypothetical protein